MKIQNIQFWKINDLFFLDKSYLYGIYYDMTEIENENSGNTRVKLKKIE